MDVYVFIVREERKGNEGRKCIIPSPSSPISPILSLCKYGPASEEVGQGSDDWRLGTIFPRYFLPLGKKDISLMEFFNNGSRGWERDTCPIVDKIVLPATKFRNFCATHLHTLQSCAFACLHIGQKITVCKNMFYHVYKFSLKHVLAQMYLYIETLELPCFMFAHEHTYKLAHCAPCILLEAKAPE